MTPLSHSRLMMAAVLLASRLAAAGDAEDVAAAARALSDPDAKVRQEAASALWKKEKAAAPAKAALAKALDDPSPAVAIRAAGALSYLGMSDAELAPARERVLESPDARSEDRFMAARGLVGLRPAAELATPVLAYLEEYPTGNNAASSRRTLERLAKTGDRGLIAPLVDALRRSTKPGAKSIIIATLRYFEPKAEDVAVWGPAVAAMTRDPDASVRNDAVYTLGMAGSLASAYADAVKAVLDDPDESVRGHAAEALAAMQPKTVKASVDSGSAFQALMTLDLPAVRGLLDAGLSPNENLGGNGSPLYVALQWAPLSCSPAVRPTKPETQAIVKMLLERGADANVGDAGGNTPLMAAASHGCDRGVMRALIAAGARVDAVGKTGLTAFEQGLASGHDGLEEIIAAGYRLAPERAKALEQAYAGKPASLALVKKAARK